ncbi:hypothetical protein A2415_03200 [candidate division WWE3 bacterium RIFOXYC1_FULL_39_7]|uniref:Cytoplasmic protein n=2 Tax=Katanobacteria TaxID=422282 RepID=A0A1F4X462_UNCKA|nr:MAG: hypothetical protein A2415_03200 [candidate division WWE3 bacterium RIFOXYC1_FULL_39_7]OGC76369.1 MAG: hypothetical protein A2619_00215 [candidate division WWE3 bacterium RIFOXYD1_FULL_39_9]
MPFRDGTGPQGKGPKTGRGFGRCSDSRGQGMGRNMGFGRGRGFRSWFASLSKNEVKEDLSSYQKALETELELIKTEQKKLEEEQL